MDFKTQEAKLKTGRNNSWYFLRISFAQFFRADKAAKSATYGLPSDSDIVASQCRVLLIISTPLVVLYPPPLKSAKSLEGGSH